MRPWPSLVHRTRVIGLSLLALASLGMVPASYASYTSLGFDLRRHDGGDWVNTMIRLQWPGDGSVRLGGERQRKPIFERPIDRWDWAGRFFDPPLRQTPRTAWNRAGFWWVEEAYVGHAGARTATRNVTEAGETIHGRWLAVPSWLPALAAVAAWAWFGVGRRVARSM